jgi:hypothetical protein
MKTIYYDSNGPGNQPGFRGGGTGWWVSSDRNRPWDEHFGEFDISEPLYWAIFHLGLIDDFAELPYDGLLGSYEEGILKSSGLGNAVELLRQKAESLTESTYEWTCSKQFSPNKIEYKIRVDAATLKQELLALADFLSRAASHDYDVQLWL